MDRAAINVTAKAGKQKDLLHTQYETGRQKMLGNHRLFQAVRTLATAKGDVRTRVCIAMADIRVIGSMEFRNMPDLWKRIERLKKETSAKGPYVLNGRTIRNSYENTAYSRQNKTYEKYAEEILAIWLDTCEEENSQP